MPPILEPLTYEEVTEVYRREQKTKNVTEMRKDFYTALHDLLDRLRKESEREMAVDQFSAKAGLLGAQMKKISDKALQIFEFRAEKIMLSALRAAGGATVDLERLTSEERRLYDSVLALLRDCRTDVLEAERKLREEALYGRAEAAPKPVSPAGEKAVRSPTSAAPSVETLFAETGEIDREAAEDIEDEVEVVASPLARDRRLGRDYLLLRILEDVPEFAGPDRNYRLSKEDVVTLPACIARALIGKGKAVEISPGRLA
mgnify:FL=1